MGVTQANNNFKVFAMLFYFEVRVRFFLEGWIRIHNPNWKEYCTSMFTLLTLLTGILIIDQGGLYASNSVRDLL